MRIPHSRPALPTAEEWAEVTGRLASGWIADGPCENAFAQAAAEWLGAGYPGAGGGGVAVNSGTSALHLALLAVDVQPGSEVLIPAYCCAALLNAVVLAGAVPVLVDSEPGGFNLSAEEARRRLSPRTAAVVVAHMFGRPAPIAPFLELSVPVIEDCAQSLGAREDGRLTGSCGAVAIGSFYATKVITTGQGGLVSTRDPDALNVLRDLVEYDNRDDWQPRFNYRMSEVQAALGLWQLERLPAFLERRRSIAEYYDAAILGFWKSKKEREIPPAGISSRERPGCPQERTVNGPVSSEPASGAQPASARLPCDRPFVHGRGVERVGTGPASVDPLAGAICYRYLLRVPDAGVAIAALQALGVDAKRPVYRPLHHYLGGDFPHAQAAHEQLVSLPLYPALLDREAERVAAAVRAAALPIRRC